jgi:uncharacterized protein YerC
MNTLTDAQRDRVLALLRQGKTLRRIEQETGHRRETVAELAARLGFAGRYSTLKRYVRTTLTPSRTGTMMLAA